MKISDDPNAFAKKWFFITLFGVITYALVVVIFIL